MHNNIMLYAVWGIFFVLAFFMNYRIFNCQCTVQVHTGAPVTL